MPTGTIAFFSTPIAPKGWLATDGAAVNQATYANLYALIGDTFGAAPAGQFRLPDYAWELNASDEADPAHNLTLSGVAASADGANFSAGSGVADDASLPGAGAARTIIAEIFVRNLPVNATQKRYPIIAYGDEIFEQLCGLFIDANNPLCASALALNATGYSDDVDEAVTTAQILNKWVTVAMTLADGEVSLWLDGAQLGEAAAEVNWNTAKTGTVNVGFYATDHFDGEIRNLRVFDFAMGESDIAAYMADAQTFILSAPPVAGWPLNLVLPVGIIKT